MAHTPDLPHFFEENINLEGLFDILSPKNNLVLADDMMLSDADGIILRVSENYERLLIWKRTGPSGPVSLRRSSGRRKRSPPPRPSTTPIKMS